MSSLSFPVMNAVEIHRLLKEYWSLNDDWTSAIESEICLFVNHRQNLGISYGRFRSGSIAAFFSTGIRLNEMEDLLAPIYQEFGLYQRFDSFYFMDKRCSVGHTINSKDQVKAIADDLWPKIEKRFGQLDYFRNYKWICDSLAAEEVDLQGRRYPILCKMIIKKLAKDDDYQQFCSDVLERKADESCLRDHSIDYQFAASIYEQLERNY